MLVTFQSPAVLSVYSANDTWLYQKTLIHCQNLQGVPKAMSDGNYRLAISFPKAAETLTFAMCSEDARRFLS